MSKKMAEKSFPTKEEIKTARAVMRKVSVARRAKFKKRHSKRRHIRAVDQTFYTWTHDMRTVLASSARNVYATSAEVAQRANAVADSMASLIAERQPRTSGGRASRKMPAWRLWHIWQAMFDSMIHEMAAHSDLYPGTIVARACEIADKAMPHIKRRYRR